MQILTNAYENTQADQFPWSDTVCSNIMKLSDQPYIFKSTPSQSMCMIYSVLKGPDKYNYIYTQSVTSNQQVFIRLYSSDFGSKT